MRVDNARRSEKIRIVCIGDAHDAPHIPDKSRFAQIGRYIRTIRPDVVVQIGDFATLNSLSTHAIDADGKPSFMADMASFDEALGTLNIIGAERHCTLGNHEARLYRFERTAPPVTGMMRHALQETFARHQWSFSPYGQVTLYGGVGFAHTTLNQLGRTYGGKAPEQDIANDALHDLVLGHSHVHRHHRAPKIGGNNSIQIINAGCALPDNHMEDFARHSVTGWSYGIVDLAIQHGHVQDYSFITMATLAEKFRRKLHGPPRRRAVKT